MTNQTEKVFRAFADEDYKSALERTVKAGYTPLTAAGVAQAFISGDLPDDKSYATTTGVVYLGKMQPGCGYISEFSAESLIGSGILPKMSCGIIPHYSSRASHEEGFNLSELLHGKLTKESASEHAGWLKLLDGDKDLQKALVEYVFDTKGYGGAKGAMAFHIREIGEETGIRPVVLSGTNDRFSANVLQGDYPVRVAGIGEEGNYGREDAILDLALDRMGPGDFKAFKKDLEKITF